MHVPAAHCPVCYAPRSATISICEGCGLVFASYSSAGAPPMPAPAPTLANGRYAIQRVLSRGGMGAIYLATDRSAFDRPVVLKAMLDYFDPDNPQELQAAHQRFLEEARTLAALRHPAIPQIYSYFQDGSRSYIVMEYIAGRDLEQGLTHYDNACGQLLSGQPYPQAEVLRWGVALCKVLEYLASRQPHPVIHHDIKPANLLLDLESGAIRLVDFGTAKTRLLVQNNGNVGMQQSSLYGTHGYAAPEQYRGQSEPRSDIYALAATLYHLATDDDPSAHPFSFPQLDSMGMLGNVLRPALHLEVEQRPSATHLREQLENLLNLAGARTLTAPDGTKLNDMPTLVGWCEQNWNEARSWLHSDLPNQIEIWWGQTKLAEELRTLLAQPLDHNIHLDAALAMLDPLDYGQCRPQISIGAAELDFGRLDINGRRNHTLTLANQGRRFVRFTVDHPPWVSVAPTVVGTRNLNTPFDWQSLVPGTSTTLYITADMRHQRVGGRIGGKLHFRVNNALGREVALVARTSAWHIFWRRRPFDAAFVVIVVLLTIVLIALPLLS